MVQLENCPCCGGPGMLKDTHGKIRQGWVGCKPCGLYINWKISPAGAIAKWNKRAVCLPASLTPDGLRLIKYIPEAVNALAARLAAKLDEAVLYGDYPEVRTGGASPAPTQETEVTP